MKYKTTILLTTLIALLTLGSAQGPTTNLELDVIQTEPVPLQAGEYADIWVRATNTGTTTATQPEFEVLDTHAFTPTGKTVWTPRGGLQRGESYDMRIEVRVNENAIFGDNELEIRKTSNAGETTITDSLSLPVRTDNRSLIVSSLDFPERVEPGSSGEMTLTLENLAQSQFRNIDVNLDVEELPIAPRETSRQRIGSINSNSEASITYILDVDDDADNELHDLPITINYQDQAGNQLSMRDTTGINIGGFPNIDVAVEQSDIRTPGQGTVTFRILNRGEGQARFAEIQLEDTEQIEIISEPSIYLGSMIADDFQTAEFEVYVEKNIENQVEFPVTVDYRDGEGDQTTEFNIERQLYTSEELQKYGLDDTNTPILLIIVIAGILIGGGYYWRKRKQKSDE